MKKVLIVIVEARESCTVQLCFETASSDIALEAGLSLTSSAGLW